MSSILLFLFGSTLFHSAIATVSNIGRFGFVKDAYETGARSYRNKIGQVEYFLAYISGEDSADKISHRGIGTSAQTELHLRDTLFQRRRRNPATILNWALASSRPQTARYIVRDPLLISQRMFVRYKICLLRCGCIASEKVDSCAKEEAAER